MSVLSLTAIQSISMHTSLARVKSRFAYHETIRSASAAPGGILPSARSFSIRVISAKLFAFLIISCTLFFSESVNCVRTPLRAPESESPFVAAPTVKLWAVDLMPFIFLANSVGSSLVPKSSFACSRSTSRTRWKSRNRREGTDQMR